MKAAALAPLALSLSLLACSPAPPAAPRPRPPPLVVAGKASVRDVPVEVSSPVELRPFAQADVVSKVVGYLDTVMVERGDRVRAGQLLARVHPSDLVDQRASAEGALSQVEAAIELARSNLARAEALVPAGRVSKQELEHARSALAQAEAQRRAVKAQGSAVATRLGETRLVAPFDGVVMQRRLDPGALVGPGTGAGAIVTVARVDTLKATLTVTERDAAGVEQGLEAHVALDAFPGRRFTGRVARLAPSFDPVTRTLELEVRLPNRSGELRPGLYGRGAVVTALHAGALTVPVAAVQLVRDQRFVFVLEGDKVRRTRVETGVDGETWLEIVKGLDATAEVVTAGVDGLADGMTVRVARGVDPFTGTATGGASAPAAAPAK